MQGLGQHIQRLRRLDSRRGADLAVAAIFGLLFFQCRHPLAKLPNGPLEQGDHGFFSLFVGFTDFLSGRHHIAGLAEELKREDVPLLVIDIQVDAIPLMKTWTKPEDHYIDITGNGNVVISCAQSRELLSEMEIAGEILSTPGHSRHCVSLLLDDGSVFTGDLPPEAYAFDNPVALTTWRLLRERGATRIYPAHGPIRGIDEVRGE